MKNESKYVDLIAYAIVTDIRQKIAFRRAIFNISLYSRLGI